MKGFGKGAYNVVVGVKACCVDKHSRYVSSYVARAVARFSVRSVADVEFENFGQIHKEYLMFVYLSVIERVLEAVTVFFVIFVVVPIHPA